MQQKYKKKLADQVAPIAGVTGIAVCPICIPVVASVMSYIGLAGIVPFFPRLSMALLGIGLIGFFFDYKKHGSVAPSMMLFAGALVLYLGRYHYGDSVVWITGIFLILFGVYHNRRILKSKTSCCSVKN